MPHAHQKFKTGEEDYLNLSGIFLEAQQQVKMKNSIFNRLDLEIISFVVIRTVRLNKYILKQQLQDVFELLAKLSQCRLSKRRSGHISGLGFSVSHDDGSID